MSYANEITGYGRIYMLWGLINIGLLFSKWMGRAKWLLLQIAVHLWETPLLSPQPSSPVTLLLFLCLSVQVCGQVGKNSHFPFSTFSTSPLSVTFQSFTVEVIYNPNNYWSYWFFWPLTQTCHPCLDNEQASIILLSSSWKVCSGQIQSWAWAIYLFSTN